MGDKNQIRVLVTSHHWFNLNSGAVSADCELVNYYSKYFQTDFITYTDLSFKNVKLAKFIFPAFVLFHIVKKRVQNSPYSIIHSNTGDLAFYLYFPFSKRTLNITQSHGLEFYRDEIAPQQDVGYHKIIKRFWTNPTISLTLKKADLIVTINEGEASWIERNLPLSKIIRSSIGFSDFGNKIELTKKNYNESFVGAYFGQSSLALKGLDFLVSRLKNLLLNFEISEFIFVGLNKKDAETVSSELWEFENRVMISHEYVRSDLPKLVSKADFFVISSRSEGGPITLLEGMALGLIPISNNLPFPQTLLKPEFAYCIFDINQPETFDQAIETARKNKPNRKELQNIAEKYRWHVVLFERVNQILDTLQIENFARKK